MTVGSTPFFSVLIASYNRPEYIAECIDSILANDCTDFELIASDDCSPKATEIESVLERYKALPNFRFFRQAHNLREPGNRNFLVEQARGQFNIIIGDDDTLFPDSLRRIKTFIEAHPDHDLYAFGYRVMDEAGRPRYERFAPAPVEISLDQPQMVKEALVADMLPFWLYHPAVFCCRSGIERQIPYSSRAGIGDDFLFMVDFLNAGKRLIVIPEVLFSWRKVVRVAAGSQKNQSFDNRANLEARARILRLMTARRDLRSPLAELVASSEYRERFLYAPLASDRRIAADELEALGLSTEDIRGFAPYRARSGRWLAVRLLLRRSLGFVRLFGFRGLWQLVKISWQRMVYPLVGPAERRPT